MTHVAALSLKEKVELLKRREQKRTNVIPSVRPAEHYAISYGQRRLWVLCQFDRGNIAYNTTTAYRVAGPLDSARFAEALRRLIRRHEALRTRFILIDGEPRQIVEPDIDLVMPQADCRASDDADGDVRRLAAQERGTPFDLESAPLLRVKLVRTADQAWVFLFTIHHIVSDGTSMALFVSELVHEYVLLSGSGGMAPLGPVAVQYKDYAMWQHQRVESGALEPAKAYWQATLREAPTAVELPMDRSPAPIKSYRGDSSVVWLSAEELARLKRVAADHAATLFMLLTAAVNVLLYRYTGKTDIVVGMPVEGRTQPQLRNVFGFFVDTVPLRTSIDGTESFAVVLARVKQRMLSALEYQEYPLTKIVEELALPRTTGRHPLFSVLVVMDDPMPPLAIPGVSVAPFPLSHGISRFDVTFKFAEADGRLGITFEYDTDLFDAARINRMGKHFKTALSYIGSNPNASIHALDLLTSAEKTTLLGPFGGGPRSRPSAETVHARFEREAARAPGAPAVTCGECTLSYAELNERSNRLARRIRAGGVKPDDIVAILFDRSLAMVVAMLAVLKSGAAYLPLKPSDPEERLTWMLRDSQCRLAVTDERHIEALSAIVASIGLEEPDSGADGRNLEDVVRSDNLAYIIYTSGSTGTPKGVMVEHRNLVGYVDAVVSRLELARGLRHGVVSSYATDLGYTTLYSAWFTGGCIVVLDDAEATEPARFQSRLRAGHLDVLKITPTHYAGLVGGMGVEISPLQRLIFGGETVTRDIVAGAVHRHPGCRIFNHYGPTETTVGAVAGEITPLGDRIALGQPLDNGAVYILGPGGTLLPVGVAGEIHISGFGVARGYLAQREPTEQKFLPDPFQPGQRMYRTGDLGRWTEDGRIEFLGRIDDQLKIRGHRVEPREIEAVLTGHPSIGAAAVVPEGVGANLALRAYYVEKAAVSAIDLREYLGRRLPGHMVPRLTAVKSMPLTPSGKIDRIALRSANTGQVEARVPPRSEAERGLLRVFAETLGTTDLGIRDDFFEAGGHSLMAIRLIGEASKTLGANVSLKDLLECPTVEKLAQRIQHARTQSGATISNAIVALKTEPVAVPLYVFHPIGGMVLCYTELARKIVSRPVYAVQAEPSREPRSRWRSIGEMADRYAAEIAKNHRAALLAGWSFGGLLAYEVAVRLRRLNIAADEPLLIDAWLHRAAPPDRTQLLREFLFDRALTIRRIDLVEDFRHRRDLSYEDLAAAAVAHGLFEDESQIDRFLGVYAENAELAARYAPTPCDGRILYVESTAAAGQGSAGWKAALPPGAVQVVSLPGGHYDLLQGENAQRIADLVDARPKIAMDKVAPHQPLA